MALSVNDSVSLSGLLINYITLVATNWSKY